MDDYNGSIKPINDSKEEDPDLNSAPIPSESEIKNNTPIPNVNYTNEQYYNINNNNTYYNQEEVIYPEYIERPIIEQNNEIGLCRIIIQYILIILLYGCTIWGALLQKEYGINLAIFDDVAIFSLASIMLFYTLKKRAITGKKLGCFIMIVAFGGFMIRGFSFLFITGDVLIGVGLLIARTFILIYCITMNSIKNK